MRRGRRSAARCGAIRGQRCPRAGTATYSPTRWCASAGVTERQKSTPRICSPTSPSSCWPTLLLDRVDRARPDIDLIAGQRAVRFLPAVFVFEAVDVVAVLFARQQRAIAHVVLQIGAADAEPPQQFFGDPRRHVLPFVR